MTTNSRFADARHDLAKSVLWDTLCALVPISGEFTCFIEPATQVRIARYTIVAKNDTFAVIILGDKESTLDTDAHDQRVVIPIFFYRVSQSERLVLKTFDVSVVNEVEINDDGDVVASNATEVKLLIAGTPDVLKDIPAELQYASVEDMQMVTKLLVGR